MAFKRATRRLFKRRSRRRFGFRRARARRSRFNVDRVKLRQTHTLTGSASAASLYSVTNLPTGAAGWAGISGMYQYYRVTGIAIRFFPRGNVAQITGTGATPGNTAHYICHDLTTADWAETGNNIIRKALSFSNVRMRNSLQPWKVYFRMNRITTLTSPNTIPGGFITTDLPCRINQLRLLALPIVLQPLEKLSSLIILLPDIGVQ
ncbi:capsid [Circovirus sp.]|nr:capsid [Circovirus sp.]